MLSVNKTLRNCFNDSLLMCINCCLQLIHFKLIYTQSKSKCVQKNNDKGCLKKFQRS